MKKKITKISGPWKLVIMQATVQVWVMLPAIVKGNSIKVVKLFHLSYSPFNVYTYIVYFFAF